jgi:hypothetical protein
MTPAGLEHAIPGSVGRCFIHWATGPMIYLDTGIVSYPGSSIILQQQLFRVGRDSEAIHRARRALHQRVWPADNVEIRRKQAGLPYLPQYPRRWQGFAADPPAGLSRLAHLIL